MGWLFETKHFERRSFASTNIHDVQIKTIQSREGLDGSRMIKYQLHV